MNLIEDRWIPVRRRSGRLERIAPWQLGDDFDEDPIARVAAPRPDFNGALVQFLIGLLQTCRAPDDERGWRSGFRRPPDTTELETAFARVAYAFHLDGDGPRFLQDLTLCEEHDPSDEENKGKSIGDLLIEVPTGQTLERNADLFVKRGRINALCCDCAAAALMTLQTNSPAGGRGFRTSIRGGGPLTTLLLADSLWSTCWLGVLERDLFLETTGNPEKIAPADLFPWLAPTRTSASGQATTPEDAHPAQIFWAMPRRIRLIFSEDRAACDLCGNISGKTLRHYMAKPYGVNYEGPWKHPLSPYYFDSDGIPNPVHPQPGGIGYRHWLGLVLGIEGDRQRREPARIVERYLQRGAEDMRLWAFGYDMDKNKARCWYDGTMPLLICPSSIRAEFAFRITAMIKGADLASHETRMRLKNALFKPGIEVRGDLSFISNRFWQETEAEFYALLPVIRQSLQETADVTPLLERWHKKLVTTAGLIFEDVSQSGAWDAADPKSIALAWNELRKKLLGRGMRTILGLPVRENEMERGKGGKKRNV